MRTYRIYEYNPDTHEEINTLDTKVPYEEIKGKLKDYRDAGKKVWYILEGTNRIKGKFNQIVL
jgi:hypothetical protein